MTDYNISYKKRDNGKWSYQITYKDNYEGKWKYHSSKSGFRTKREAVSAAQGASKKIKVPTKYDKLTFNEVGNMYIELKKDSVNTVYNYKFRLKALEGVGDYVLNDIDFFKLQLVFSDMSKKWKHNTVSSIKSFGSMVFDFAIDKLRIDVNNPFRQVELKETQDSMVKEPTVLTYKEMMDLFDQLAKIDINYKLLAQFMGLCGLRVSEAKAIRPAVLDLKNKEVTINMQHHNDKRFTSKLKSNNSYRTLKLPETIIKTLQEIPWPMDDESPVYTRFIYSYTMTSIYQKCGYNITNHDLRHSFGTMLAQNGVDYKTIADNLGDTLETTISTYSHSNTEMQEIANNIIESF